MLDKLEEVIAEDNITKQLDILETIENIPEIKEVTAASTDLVKQLISKLFRLVNTETKKVRGQLYFAFI